MEAVLYSGLVPRARVLDPCHEHSFQAGGVYLTFKHSLVSPMIQWGSVFIRKHSTRPLVGGIRIPACKKSETGTTETPAFVGMETC